MLEGLRGSLRLALARGPGRWQPAPPRPCRLHSGPAVRCVPPPLSAAPRSRSLPMASPPRAAAALARQVPRPRGSAEGGDGLDPRSPKPFAAVSCTVVLRPAPPFRLQRGVPSSPSPARNLESHPANLASERPLPARSNAPRGTRSGARRGQPWGAGGSPWTLLWGRRRERNFWAPEPTATSRVSSPPQNILTAAFCLFGSLSSLSLVAI